MLLVGASPLVCVVDSLRIDWLIEGLLCQDIVILGIVEARLCCCCADFVLLIHRGWQPMESAGFPHSECVWRGGESEK